MLGSGMFCLGFWGLWSFGFGGVRGLRFRGLRFRGLGLRGLGCRIFGV